MQERRYLLDIRQMLEGRDSVFREVLERIDSQRRRKALRPKSAGVKAAGAGAGLLIQKALADFMDCGRTEPRPDRVLFQRFSVEELLADLGGKVIEPCYRYGENGKPYLEDYPLYFNLSHSGDYVFCGVSGQEIGVDIQRFQGENELELARRFFSPVECQALEGCKDAEGRRRMFFRMWTRKEAYGKLTGEGISGVLEKDLWTDGAAGEAVLADGVEEEAVLADGAEGEAVLADDAEEEAVLTDGAAGEAVLADDAKTGRSEAAEIRISGRGGKALLWEEYEEPSGYLIAVCRHGI